MQSKPNRAEKLETIRQTIEHMSDQELDMLFDKVRTRVGIRNRCSLQYADVGNPVRQRHCSRCSYPNAYSDPISTTT